MSHGLPTIEKRTAQSNLALGSTSLKLFLPISIQYIPMLHLSQDFKEPIIPLYLWGNEALNNGQETAQQIEMSLNPKPGSY
jgi:hypothetical protein